MVKFFSISWSTHSLTNDYLFFNCIPNQYNFTFLLEALSVNRTTYNCLNNKTSTHWLDEKRQLLEDPPRSGPCLLSFTWMQLDRQNWCGRWWAWDSAQKEGAVFTRIATWPGVVLTTRAGPTLPPSAITASSSLLSDFSLNFKISTLRGDGNVGEVTLDHFFKGAV